MYRRLQSTNFAIFLQFYCNFIAILLQFYCYFIAILLLFYLCFVLIRNEYKTRYKEDGETILRLSSDVHALCIDNADFTETLQRLCRDSAVALLSLYIDVAAALFKSFLWPQTIKGCFIIIQQQQQHEIFKKMEKN